MSAPTPTVSGTVDPAYEFDCPRYRDFDEAEDQNADEWFDQNGKVSDVLGEQTAEVFAAVQTSTLTMPIQGLQLATEIEVEKIEGVQEETAVVVAAPVVAEEITSVTVEHVVVVEPAVETATVAMEVDSEVVQPAAIATATEAAIEEMVAPITAIASVEEQQNQEVQPMEVQEESGEINVSIHAASTLARPHDDSALSDIPIEQTDETSFSHDEERDSLLDTRSSMAFSMAATAKRSSLPALDVQEGVPTVEYVVTPLAHAANQANNLSAEVAAAAAQTDIEVEALEQSLLQAPEQSTEEEAPLDALVEDESDLQPKSIMDQFAAVADEEEENLASSAVHEPLPMIAPSTGRKVIASAGGVNKPLPSFLRPTQAAMAKIHSKVTAAASNDAKVSAPGTARRVLQVVKDVGAALAASSATPAPRKRRAGTSLEELARPKTAVKKHSEESLHGVATPAPGTARKAGAPKLTIAHSPALSTRVRAKGHGPSTFLSSEEQELQRIEKERQDLAKEKSKNQKWHLAHLSGGGSVETNVDATLPLRSAAHLTQPEEFTFQTAKRAKLVATPGPHEREEKSSSQGFERTHSTHELTLTKPAPFKLSTATRVRPAAQKVLSKEEQEELEMANIQPFKALPFNEKIFSTGGEIGVPRIVKAKLTDPTSPNLATKERGEKRKQIEGGDESTKEGAAKDGAPKSAKKPRSVGPFNLATAERGRKTEEELAKARAESASVFQTAIVHAPAAPMHSSLQHSTPRITLPQAPKVLEHHARARAKLEAERQALLDLEKQQHEFRARPLPCTSMLNGSACIEIKKSDRPLTNPEAVHLASEERAEKRAVFDESLAAQQAAAEALAKQQKLESEQAAQAELKEYRKTLVLRAHPAPNMIQPTFVPKLSMAKLTQPESPALITKRRAITKIAQEQNLNTVQEMERDVPQGQENQLPTATLMVD